MGDGLKAAHVGNGAVFGVQVRDAFGKSIHVCDHGGHNFFVRARTLGSSAGPWCQMGGVPYPLSSVNSKVTCRGLQLLWRGCNKGTYAWEYVPQFSGFVELSVQVGTVLLAPSHFPHFAPVQVPDRDGVWKDIPGLPTRAYADDGEVLLPGGSAAATNFIPVVGFIVPIVAVVLLFLMIFIATIRHKIAPDYPGELPRFGLRQDITDGDQDDDGYEDEDEDAMCVEVARVETRVAAAPQRRTAGPKGLAYGESQEMQLCTDFSGDDSLERAIAIACHNRDAGGDA